MSQRVLIRGFFQTKWVSLRFWCMIVTFLFCLIKKLILKLSLTLTNAAAVSTIRFLLFSFKKVCTIFLNLREIIFRLSTVFVWVWNGTTFASTVWDFSALWMVSSESLSWLGKRSRRIQSWRNGWILNEKT